MIGNLVKVELNFTVFFPSEAVLSVPYTESRFSNQLLI